jgi:hypothetical protein
MLRTCNAFVRYNSPKDLNLLQADSDTPLSLLCVGAVCAVRAVGEEKWLIMSSRRARLSTTARV